MTLNVPSFFAGIGTVVVLLMLGFGGGVMMSGVINDKPREPGKVEMGRRSAEGSGGAEDARHAEASHHHGDSGSGCAGTSCAATRAASDRQCGTPAPAPARGQPRASTISGRDTGHGAGCIAAAYSRTDAASITAATGKTRRPGEPACTGAAGQAADARNARTNATSSGASRSPSAGGNRKSTMFPRRAPFTGGCGSRRSMTTTMTCARRSRSSATANAPRSGDRFSASSATTIDRLSRPRRRS